MQKSIPRRTFSDLQKSGRKVRGRFFSATVMAADTAEGRFSCVVSKKVAAHAVDRNRIKRCAREAMRRAIKRIPRHMVVLYATRAAHGASFSDLERDILDLAERASRP